jgi:glycosyltransferase involved in cell wall biosynthesis
VPVANFDVSVVIPTYKRSDRLASLMDALDAQTLDAHRFEVIIVDNFSNDDTFETAQKLTAGARFAVQLLQMSHNQGPAPARNVGWQAAKAPIVAFLDDDCLPVAHWLASALSFIAGDSRLGVVQGGVRAPADFDPTGMESWYHCQIIDGPTPYFEACNIFYRTDALREAGGFDEGIGWWCEDTALGWKVLESGWSRGFSPDAMVAHEVQPRGWRWYFKNGLLEHNTVRMARVYPGFRRDAFWRPWAHRREDAGFALAVVGILAARRTRFATLLALPYLWWRFPRPGQPAPLHMVAQNVAVDAARAVGQLRGTLSHRVFVI